MKKTMLIWVLAIVLVLATCMGIFFGLSPKKVKTDSKAVYSLSAFTSAMFLSGTGAGGIQSVNLMDNGITNLTRPELLDADIFYINKYLSSFESVIEKNSLTQIETKPSAEIDGEYANLYNIKLSTNLESINGTTNFVMYYNEISDDNTAHGNKIISGIMILNNNQYLVTGNKYMDKITFTTRSKENSNEYMTVKQEIENNKEIFYYSFYQNDKLISKTKIAYEYDMEDNKQKLTVHFLNPKEDNSNVKYWFARIIENGEISVHVKARTNREIVKFIVTLDDGKYKYSYANGFTEMLPKM